jgi:hypothetical protein
VDTRNYQQYVRQLSGTNKADEASEASETNEASEANEANETNETSETSEANEISEADFVGKRSTKAKRRRERDLRVSHRRNISRSYYYYLYHVLVNYGCLEV